MPSNQVTPSQPQAYIRFFHIVPTHQSYHLLIDDKLYKKNWTYQDFTPYFKVSAGQHHIQVKHSQDDVVLFEKRINVKPKSAFTYLFSEHPKQDATYHLFNLEDTNKAIHSPHGFLRFGHFSKACLPTKLISDEEHTLFKNTQYAQLTKYTPLSPASYPFTLLCHENNDTLLTLKSKPLKLGRLYTLYLIGEGTKLYPFQLVRSIDGPSYLNFNF